jgi:hypothetical protein
MEGWLLGTEFCSQLWDSQHQITFPKCIVCPSEQEEDFPGYLEQIPFQCCDFALSGQFYKVVLLDDHGVNTQWSQHASKVKLFDGQT